jgi:hypothetical protein
MSAKNVLAYCLTDASGRFWWATGFHRVGSNIPALWPDKTAAQLAAAALRRALGIVAVPAALRPAK